MDMDRDLFEDSQVNVKEQNLERQLISLVFEKDEQIERLNAEIERLAAEKDGRSGAPADRDGEVERLQEQNIRLTIEKGEQSEQIERLKAEIAKLGASQGEKGQAEGLLAEKNEQIEWLNARLRRLATEKDEKDSQIKKLTAEKDELVKNSTVAASAEQQTRFSLENTGSLAEASISVSGVLRAAQEAADVYLQNIKMLEAEKTAAARKIEEDARERAGAIIREAEQRRREIEEAEKKALGDLRSVSFLYMDFIDKSHSALHEMIDRYKLTKFTHGDEPGLAAKNL